MLPDEVEAETSTATGTGTGYSVDSRLHNRTLLKLDCLLLPFLALLFLFNALDKSNVSHALNALSLTDLARESDRKC